jgi:CelD/BcsL family acetyltransferase involved in cellulose biosynthesis
MNATLRPPAEIHMAEALVKRSNGAMSSVIGTAVPVSGRAASSAGRNGSACLIVMRSPQQFNSLEDDWRALETTARSCHVFQTFDWLAAWLRQYGDDLGQDRLWLALGYRGGTLVFAWPMMLTRSGPLTIMRWLSEPFLQYGDVLVHRSEDAGWWMAEAGRKLNVTRGIDGVRLRHVRDDAAAAPYLKTSFRDARYAELAPWLDLTAFADEAAYDARYSSAQRKRRKKIRKSLEDAFGPVRFDIISAGPVQTESLAIALREKSQWLDDRGRQNRVLGCERMCRFLGDLAGASGPVDLVVSQMSAGNKPVSWEIGLRSGGVHYAYITSHVNGVTDYSPARLHMDYSQRQALKDGMTAFDLMLPNDAYKDSWCSGRAATADYHLPLTLAGWSYGVLYLERMRPLLRDAYYRMPAAVLRLLKPILGH